MKNNNQRIKIYINHPKFDGEKLVQTMPYEDIFLTDESNLERVIACANCGKDLKYRNAFGSSFYFYNELYTNQALICKCCKDREEIEALNLKIKKLREKLIANGEYWLDHKRSY